MKVVIRSEIALLCTAVHYQEGIKIIANKCGLFLKFSSVETIYVFSTATRAGPSRCGAQRKT